MNWLCPNDIYILVRMSDFNLLTPFSKFSELSTIAWCPKILWWYVERCKVIMFSNIKTNKQTRKHTLTKRHYCYLLYAIATRMSNILVSVAHAVYKKYPLLNAQTAYQESQLSLTDRAFSVWCTRGLNECNKTLDGIGETWRLVVLK